MNALIDAYLARLPDGVDRVLQRVGERRVAGHYYSARLASVFQPVFDSSRTLTGHAAYVRSYDDGETPLSPWQLFALAAGDDDLVRLDRLCRTVHAINYFAAAEPDWRLHLAVEQRLVLSVPSDHGRVFRNVLNAFGIGAGRVVIELPQGLLEVPAVLGAAIANYRHCGYAVSVRVPPEAAAIESLLYFRPDIVRLRLPQVPRGRVRALVDAVHEIGAQALVEHVEGSAERVVAESAGADLVQGYGLGSPRAEVERDQDAHATPSGRVGWLDDSATLIGSGPLI